MDSGTARGQVATHDMKAMLEAQPGEAIPAVTGIPRLIKFNGLLRDLAGKPLAGPVDVTFSLYTDESGGVPLWFETQTVSPSADGNYTVLLGAMSPTGVPIDLFASGEAHWLGVQVSNLPEQARVLLVSVPYAMKAGDAETLGGKPASAYLLSSQADAHAAAAGVAAGTLSGLITQGVRKTTTSAESPITQTFTQNYIPVFSDNTGAVTNSIIVQSGTKIGINTNAPAFSLDLNGNVFMVGTKTASPGNGGTMRFRDDTGTQRWLFGIPGSAGSQDFQVYNYSNGHAPIFVQNGAASYSLYMSGTGNVGIGTSSPAQKLSVAGIIQSTSGGFKFPDGTTQTTAATGGGGGAGVSSFNGRTGVVVSATNDYSFGQISGSLGSAQLSGTYSNVLTLSNASNSFTGNGSGLTNLAGANVTGTVASATSAATATSSSGLSCTGCVGNTQLGVNYAGSSSQGGAATNALALNGVAASGYATLGANSFTGDQAISGNLTVSSQTITGDLTLNGTVNGWVIVPYTSQTCTIQGSSLACLSGNVLGGYTGFGGKFGATLGTSGTRVANSVPLGANTIGAGVVGATISGGGGTLDGNSYSNSVATHWGTIAGGALNQVGDPDSATAGYCCQTIGGGAGNIVTGHLATVAGGSQNHATGLYATSGGGVGNSSSGDYSAIGGGTGNAASWSATTVSGGYGNTSSHDWATVGGGSGNTASGYYATVPGGNFNAASGNNSFAAGCYAQAAHAGAFVWGGSDGSSVSTCTTISSSAAGQFLALAPGGVKFYSNTALTAGVNLAAGGGSWSSVSDRNAKRELQPVDGADLLAKLDRIPLSTWSYKSQDASIRHMGPMAQDLYAAFHLGEDDRHITDIDGQGVALAGVQALYRLSIKKDEEIRALVQQNEKLTKEVEQLKKQTDAMAALETRLDRVEAQQKSARKKLARVARQQKKHAGNKQARVDS